MDGKAATQFKPGRSYNPGGKPRNPKTIARRAEDARFIEEGRRLAKERKIEPLPGKIIIIKDVREAARAYTFDAIETLRRVATDLKAPPSAQVTAATALLDRGWGKPKESLSVESKGRSFESMLIEIWAAKHAGSEDPALAEAPLIEGEIAGTDTGTEGESHGERQGEVETTEKPYEMGETANRKD
jgi:hypothetical protein